MDIEHKVNWNGSNTEQGWFTPFFKSLKIAGYADLAHSEFKITHVRVARECKGDNPYRYPGYKGFDFGLVTAYHTNENAWCRLSVTDRCFINMKHLIEVLDENTHQICGYSHTQDFWCSKQAHHEDLCHTDPGDTTAKMITTNQIVRGTCGNSRELDFYCSKHAYHEGQCHTDPGHTTERMISALKARVAELELLVEGKYESQIDNCGKASLWDHLTSDCTNCGEPAVTHNEFGFANCDRCAEEDALYQARKDRGDFMITSLTEAVNEIDDELYNSHDDLEPYDPIRDHPAPDGTYIDGHVLQIDDRGDFPYILTGSPGEGKTPITQTEVDRMNTPNKTDDVIMQAAKVKRDIFSSNDRKNIAISSFRWSALQTCLRWAAASFIVWQVV